MTDAELERLDFVHNRIYAMLCEVAGKPLDWDMEVIGEISDTA